MVQPTPKPLPQLGQKVGALDANVLPLYVREPVLEEVLEYSARDLRHEIGGFLIGGLHRASDVKPRELDPQCVDAIVTESKGADGEAAESEADGEGDDSEAATSRDATSSDATSSDATSRDATSKGTDESLPPALSGASLANCFVELRHFVAATDVHSRPASLTFTHDTWSAMNRRLESQHPNDIVLGWHHTHPNLGVFLSGYDQFIQRNFFSEPWQLAMVVDPCRCEFGFYQWRGDQIVNAGFICLAASGGPARRAP